MTDVQKRAAEQIKRIESTLAALGRALEQEKADLSTADWPTTGTLHYIADQLEGIEDYWYGRVE